MTWKEELEEWFGTLYESEPTLEQAKDFISKEIIEKLIDGLPYDEFEFENMDTLKQQLRDKWL